MSYTSTKYGFGVIDAAEAYGRSEAGRSVANATEAVAEKAAEKGVFSGGITRLKWIAFFVAGGLVAVSYMLRQEKIRERG